VARPHVPDDTFRRLDALIGVGLRLARSARSGRVALARAADAFELDWIPRPWGEELVAELERAREAAREPLAFKHVERALRDAWGGPVSDELDALDPEPVAVTPGAQVHRGELDGAPVAIKVLRPGLASTVRQDLTLIDALMSPLSAAFPALDAAGVSAELRERLLEELDLEHEATVMRRFHRALRGHPFLSVPAPITRLAHEGVLVSEWVQGVPFTEAPDPDQAAARLVVFALGAARFGTIHADLVPDNVLVRPDGGLAIVDFGATRTVDPARMDAGAATVEAFAAGEPDAFADALGRLGVLPAEHAPTALTLVREVLGDLAGEAPSRLDGAAVTDARDRLLERPGALRDLIGAATPPPEDLLPTQGAALAFATIARCGATGPWLELTRAALRDGWDAPAG
jgi:predicted unusual protein kinase regulating ubiquinone biosynthesis (AarF/ABC1/UbiB family)